MESRTSNQFLSPHASALRGADEGKHPCQAVDTGHQIDRIKVAVVLQDIGQELFLQFEQQIEATCHCRD